MDPHPLANLFKRSNYDNSLNKKHDCNDFNINSIDVNCANNMQNPMLGDASFCYVLYLLQ